MTRRKRILFYILLILLGTLWFSHALPIQVSKAAAAVYLSTQEDGEGYRIVDADFSGPFDSYFVYFENKAGGQRNIGVRYRYAPFDVWFDSGGTGV